MRFLYVVLIFIIFISCQKDPVKTQNEEIGIYGIVIDENGNNLHDVQIYYTFNEILNLTSSENLATKKMNTVNSGFDSFSAISVSNGILLEWSVSGRVIYSGYNILRKVDNSDWIKINDTTINDKSVADTTINYQLIDTNVDYNITYAYKLEAIENDSTSTFYGPIWIEINPPKETQLFQNYPNPFIEKTWITFNLETSSNVNLSIYNLSDELVKTLINKNLSEGTYYSIWDGTNDNNEKECGVFKYILKTKDYQKDFYIYRYQHIDSFVDNIPTEVTDQNGDFFINYSKLPLDIGCILLDETGNDLGTITLHNIKLVFNKNGYLTTTRDINFIDSIATVNVTLEKDE